MELVTGYWGKPHIKSAQDGVLNAGVVGAESYVLPTGGQLEASVITNNLIRIADGDIMHQGRHITIPKDTYDEVEIVNGLQGMKRKDLIVVRYVKDATTNVESASLVVIQGTSTDGTPDDPDYNDNSILDGTLISDMPLYRITLDGLTVGEPEKLFATTKSISIIGTEIESLQGDVADINSNLETKTAPISLADWVEYVNGNVFYNEYMMNISFKLNVIGNNGEGWSMLYLPKKPKYRQGFVTPEGLVFSVDTDGWIKTITALELGELVINAVVLI